MNNFSPFLSGKDLKPPKCAPARDGRLPGTGYSSISYTGWKMEHDHFLALLEALKQV